MFDAGDTRLDTNFNDLADAFEPTAFDRANCATPNNDIECQAQMAEVIGQLDFQEADWASPGKQHF